MDVTRENLDDAVKKLRRALASPRCEFVAVDEEMSGINFNNAEFGEFNRAGDSPASRYARMRPAAQAFGVVQLGLAVFVRSEDGAKLRAHVFNAYVFPDESTGGRDVTLSTGAVRFLRQHGMDFQAWLGEGVPYVNAAEEASLREHAASDARCPRDLVRLRDAGWKAFADAQLARVQALVEAAGAAPLERSEVLLDAHEAGVVRRYLYQEVERRWPRLEAEKRAGNRIAVVSLAAPEADEREAARRAERLRAVEVRVGARRLFAEVRDACRARRLPLVGHNCLYDLLFLLDHFEAPLPEDYAAFKALVAANFPVVVDTKALVERCELACKTDLGSLYNATKAEAAVEFARGFAKYGGPIEADAAEDGECEEEEDSSASLQRQFRAALDAPQAPRPQQFHEAGWDAFTTGHAFAALRKRLEALGKAPVENRLHMMRLPYEVDLAQPGFVEPLWPAPQGAAFHVRLDADARPSWDDLKALAAACGATAVHRVACVSDDGLEWLVDADAGRKGLAKAPGALPEGVRAVGAVPWAQFAEQRARFDATPDTAPPAPRAKGGARKLWEWLVAKLAPASVEEEPPRKRGKR